MSFNYGDSDSYYYNDSSAQYDSSSQYDSRPQYDQYYYANGAAPVPVGNVLADRAPVPYYQSKPGDSYDPYPYDYLKPINRLDIFTFNGREQWAVKMCSACSAEPGFMCYACWCPNCATISTRKILLKGNYNNYMCCAGACANPCCCKSLGEPCGDPTVVNDSCCSKAGCCLCCEAFCCPTISILATRYMARQMFNLALDPFEETCLYACLFCSMVDGDDDSCCDLAVSIILTCMLGQTYHEVKVRGLKDEVDRGAFLNPSVPPQGYYMT
ncbi:hypothetical protein, conserved [Angomonas deanei]|uniref:PLAC8 family n=1 Tax=Angomonas deanei TaxID=59799 RepID=A0A7G2C200_9TRYP|nr:hypothetical protein, conserved [Angomonas deanei]